jgi:hypothetical protein
MNNASLPVAVSLLALAFALGTRSQEAKHEPDTTNLDGTFWAEMDAGSKGTYVLGFAAGYFRGYVHATVDSKGPEGARATESINKAFLGGSVGDIKKQMDLFYSNYANTPICMGDAIMAVYKAQAGAAPTEQSLINTRKTDAGKCHWMTN